MGIRMKIFMPVLLLLILLPCLIYGTLRMTSTGYLRRTAEQDVRRFADQVEHVLAITEGNQGLKPKFTRDSGSPASASDLSKSEHSQDPGDDGGKAAEGMLPLPVFLERNFHEGVGDVRYVLVNQDYEAVESDAMGGSFKVDYAFLDFLSERKDTAAGNADAESSGTQYAYTLIPVPARYQDEAAYIVCYSFIPDSPMYLRRAFWLIAGITASLLVLAFIIVWRLARSIGKPMEDLCRKTKTIGIREDENTEPKLYGIAEVDQLSIAITEMQQRIARDQAEKQQIFQNVSHDLRTPLSVIIGYGEGIQSGVMPDPGKAAEVIVSEARRMHRMVEGSLILSRLGNHAWELQPVSFRLEDFLEEQVEALRRLDPEKEITLHQAQHIDIKTDPDLLIRILQNVISDCIRYAEAEVEISYGRMEQDDTVFICIEDDGPGIDAADLPHIFERYYKGEAGSFGIGLSVVASGIRYLGGRVTVENKTKPRHGACYRLYLPGSGPKTEL
jgi:two-component system sensor histidine kinase CssS